MADQSTPLKNVAFDLGFSLRLADGSVIANPGTYTKKIWKNGGAIADIAGSVTETDTTYGVLVVTLSATEMNADRVQVLIKDDTSGCVPFVQTLYPAAGSALKLLRNKVVTDPATGIMTVYDDNGSTPLYTANVYVDVAGTIPFDGTGADRRDRLA